MPATDGRSDYSGDPLRACLTARPHYTGVLYSMAVATAHRQWMRANGLRAALRGCTRNGRDCDGSNATKWPPRSTATADGNSLSPSAPRSSGCGRASPLKGTAMLADVRPLRIDGRRLSRERIAALAPRHGELIVFKRHDPWRGCWVPVASLVAEDRVSYLLPPLDQARIARWQGVDLVFVGLEEQGRGKGAARHLQSWWVRLVNDPALLRIPPSASAE